MSSAATLRTADPHELLDHPFSVSIYGQDLDEAFVESIRRRGIEQPIIVAADGKTVVAGHRRRNAAKLVGLKKVPVVVRPDLKDELEIRHAIIEANRQRVKTPEQIGREAQALWAIEQENASERRKAHLKQGRSSVRLKSDERDADEGIGALEGRSDEIVARQLGVGRDTIRKAVYVAQAIDSVIREGRAEEADSIRKYKTVNAAYREALKYVHTPKAIKEIERDELTASTELLEHLSKRESDFRTAFGLMGQLAREMELISNARAGGSTYYRTCSVAWDRLCHALIAWEENEPIGA
jgi:ParB-like chromosome segregation protein Spo0J